MQAQICTQKQRNIPTNRARSRFFLQKNRHFASYGELFSKNDVGTRYLDPKTSRWMSADPAVAEYIPGAPVNDEARKRNSELPGMGGVFNTANA
jgi:hypothetical protein